MNRNFTGASGSAQVQSPDLQGGWDIYYNDAEAAANASSQVQDFFVPFLSEYEVDLSRVLDFPSGRGRMSAALLGLYGDKVEKLVCCDANSNAIGFCAQRFAGDDRVSCVQNAVETWEVLPLDFPDNGFSFIFSWDAMVHFSYKWLNFYMTEFYRILEPGGFSFVHHSNLAAPEVNTKKSEVWQENQGWRGYTSRIDAKNIAQKAGLEVLEQRVIDWGIPNLDCITMLYKRR